MISVQPNRRAVILGWGSAMVAGLTGGGGNASVSVTRQELNRERRGLRVVDLPGFVDLQTNGYLGIDFNDPAIRTDQIHQVIQMIEKTGVTRFLPTLCTSSYRHFAACAKAILAVRHPAIVGFHMEGPYISPQDGARGAHPREFVREPTIDDFKRCQEAAGGEIRLVTLAPEIRGALPLIEYLVKNGVKAAIGHTDASPEQIQDAVRAGAGLSTHLGNGCAQMLPRHPNFLWEQLSEDRLMAGIIADGHHLPPVTVKAIIRAKSPARMILVTDASFVAGLAPGIYQDGGSKVELSSSGRLSLLGTPYLAGSSLRMDDAVGNTVRFTGLTLEEVIPMATDHPAAFLGIKPAGTVRAEWNPETCRLKILNVKTGPHV